jgi:hypothetical protein
MIMIAALVVVGAFLAWLAMTSEPSVVATPDEGGSDNPTAIASGTVVTPADFEANVKQYQGQTIELRNVPVAQLMGTQIVWIELPSGAPFLVKMDSALVAGGARPSGRVDIVGTVQEKTSQVLDQWEQRGALENAGHRAQAEYGTSYIEASAIRAASGG